MLSHGGDFIPILVNVERLQQQLKLNEDIFYQAWNWVDAYLNLEWRDAVPYYLMLRQVGKALLPDQTALPPFPTGSPPRSDSPLSLPYRLPSQIRQPPLPSLSPSQIRQPSLAFLQMGKALLTDQTALPPFPALS